VIVSIHILGQWKQQPVWPSVSRTSPRTRPAAGSHASGPKRKGCNGQPTHCSSCVNALEEIVVSPIMCFQLCFVTFCGFYIHQRYIRGFREFPLKAFPDSPTSLPWALNREIDKEWDDGFWSILLQPQPEAEEKLKYHAKYDWVFNSMLAIHIDLKQDSWARGDKYTDFPVPVSPATMTCLSSRLTKHHGRTTTKLV
jgi:hypothetical protein